MADWDRSADVVIVGSGGGALTAALAARAAGLDVLVVEKTPLIGGSTAMSGGGVWVPDNPLMRAAGSPDSPAEGRAYMDAVIGNIGPASSPARRAAYLDAGPKVVAFLQEQGIAFRYADGYPDFYCNQPGGKARGRTIEAVPFDAFRLGPWKDRLRPGSSKGLGLVGLGTELTRMSYYNRSLADLRTGIAVLARTYGSRARGQDLTANGGALAGRLLEQALARGVAIETETALSGISTEGNEVTGVTVRKGDKELRVRARHGVLLAAGGFSRSDGLRKQYGGEMASSAQWSLASPGDTGEALRYAIELGAATALMDEAIWLPGPRMPVGGPPKPYGGKRLNAFSRARWRPGSIIVDAAGNRFVNESGSFMEIGQKMFAQDRFTKAVPSWVIFDDGFRRRSLFGVRPGDLPRTWIDDGFILQAPTLRELAAKAGISPGGLEATVRQFNAHARAGRDPDFHRGESAYDKFMGDPRLGALAPLGDGPFYASALYPCDVGTCGGLLTDERARVLTEAGTPIPGLYAAGNITASIMGRRYLGAGSSIAPAMIFGYLAASDIAATAGQAGTDHDDPSYTVSGS
jgi:3-oxosteroid 1-dehydrogenase